MQPGHIDGQIGAIRVGYDPESGMKVYDQMVGLDNDAHYMCVPHICCTVHSELERNA